MNARAGHPLAERLSEFLDEGLAAREQGEVALHVESCAECAETLAGLRAVRERARALPALEAPAELWGSIESRLGGAPAPVLDLPAERERRARRWSFSTPQLAAAAAALMVVSAAGAWFAGQRFGAPGDPGESGPVASAITSTPVPDPSGSERAPDASAATDPDDAGPRAASALPPRAGSAAPGASRAPAASASLADFGTERYDTAIADLEGILAANRSRLNPATVQVVEKNLALIDRAIEEARRALAADPASPYLNDHLAQTMKRKVDLLRRVTSAIQS